VLQKTQNPGEMIEKFVASVLWAASSSPGSDTDVFQIFDHELDLSSTHALPNIELFHDAWVARGWGDAGIDAILVAHHIPTAAIHDRAMHSGLTSTADPARESTDAVSAATDSAVREVEACKNTLRSGTISWGAGTTWLPLNIDRLCNNTTNAGHTISCFQSNVATVGWSTAIDRSR
jgi:hypothetical protein